ncbi:sigma-70 family RNA polymerase sigma factor [Pseudomonas sp. PDM23]|uniref:sigma-70 family RNA polymerase sigma factor n=1 Tax=unclassified Pseudomonas TaxID=196821 RepID=UPI0017802B62|nr:MULTISPECIES: sigma-70 family RNA polymerase sigma factor [unclassified Pseudomonas]MBD9574510.1 sigma-70 family RNA polymerase sigma factor [Pseudomonas sp. PDM23]MBD9673112.1 sigma-70 family RNA polymerase sigma factor [Pseudomonas sp. PDM21]
MGRTQLADHDIHRLYADHHGWLQVWIRRKTGCSQRAADLAQDTFLRVLMTRAKGVAVYLDQPRTYLATIARGLVIDQWRRQQLEQAWLESLAAQPEAVQSSPEQLALILETLHQVDAMLLRLPLKVRRAFLLAQIDGLPYREIAMELGVSERMVKKYLAQAFLHCAVLEAELDGVLVE